MGLTREQYNRIMRIYDERRMRGDEIRRRRQEEIDRRIYVFPASSIEEHGVKIPYYDFISSHRYPECSDALKRISARIDLDAIQNFLEEISELQPVQREFYLTILTERKEKILDHSLHLMMEREQRHVPEMKM